MKSFNLFVSIIFLASLAIVPVAFAEEAATAPDAAKAATAEPAKTEAPLEKKAEAKAPAKEAKKTDRGALLNPSKLNAKAPANFKAEFETTKGKFVISVDRTWSPNGADRFFNLVKSGFFTDIAFFRVIQGFMVQFGIHGDPEISAKWRDARIPVDPVKESNKTGYLTYAMGRSPDTRTTQLFINFKDNAGLDGQGFAPVGRVSEGMDVVNSIYNGYGEGAPQGAGPDQGRIQMEGNKYLKKDFDKMDYIKSARIIK